MKVFALAMALGSCVVLGACSAGGEAAATCEGITDIPESRFLLLGETHGTVEAPAIAGRIICARAMRGPTIVGLEVPVSEQTRIDGYLQSDGRRADRDTLLDAEFWQRSRDGRSSEAMLELIDRIRVLERSGLPITLVALDEQTSVHKDRSKVLADAIRRQRQQYKDAAMVVLLGRSHASVQPASTAARLQDLQPLSILLAYHEGTAWNCRPNCAVHDVQYAGLGGVQPGFSVQGGFAGYGHVHVSQRVTASPPAVPDPAHDARAE